MACGCGELVRCEAINAKREIMTNQEDPILRSSRREGLVTMTIWLAAMLYSVGYSVLNGYNRPVESIQYVYGFPDWVFWGVVVPWVVCAIVTIWFALFFMTSDSLGEDTEYVAGDNEAFGNEAHRS